jgi:hypothetical protein
MTRPKKRDKEYYKQRLGAQDEVSIRKAAKIFDLSHWKSIRRRLNEVRPRSEAMATCQRLSQIDGRVVPSVVSMGLACKDQTTSRNGDKSFESKGRH